MSSKSPKKSRNAGKPSSKGDASASEKLPFEPAQNPKKAVKKSAPALVAKAPASSSEQSTSGKSTSKSANQPARSSTQAAAMPEVVSRRMVRRVALFSGIPAFLGVATLVISYIVIRNHWLDLPHVAVLLVNMGFFGLSVLGLSYGAISASWDEERPGGRLGWGEFTTNFARLRESWRAAKQKSSS